MYFVHVKDRQDALEFATLSEASERYAQPDAVRIYTERAEWDLDDNGNPVMLDDGLTRPERVQIWGEAITTAQRSY